MISLALPKGSLREPVAALLEAAGIPVPDYSANSRNLRMELEDSGLRVRVFQERDIPIQIALGNYDVGICRLSWIEEHLCRFPSDAVVALRDLGVGHESLYLASAPSLPADGPVRLVSEYGNIAETVAMHLRLRAYRVFSAWGAAESYPPEDADLVVMPAESEEQVGGCGLLPLHRLVTGSAWIIANRSSLVSKNMSHLLRRLMAMHGGEPGDAMVAFPGAGVLHALPRQGRRDGLTNVRIAVPDGHAQRHTAEALEAAGLRFEGYGTGAAIVRPRSEIEGLDVKLIRPQDMPQQVALGQFDLAITGRDWLWDHRARFPSSPVVEVADLRRSKYQLAAAVTEDLPADNISDALRIWRSEGKQTIRVASEYVNIADEYAREHQFGRYQVIPVTGASEGFVPEDAEILVEGTETGSSFRANHIRAIETLMMSTNCVIARQERPAGARGRLVAELIERFRNAAPPAE